ncbi:hypothetical protein TSUD_258470 [Trifolium subterraneum]|uniref:Uncharacterized protein n=1 Tax=Trifolium subterraneum TaxID=3900 RepID=A0A2Z6N575_TRISU|nr:hypothetical protein TSUD_258470 [Trifolium subterraneum]
MAMMNEEVDVSYKYDVFLSFREDTYCTFTGCSNGSKLCIKSASLPDGLMELILENYLKLQRQELPSRSRNSVDLVLTVET